MANYMAASLFEEWSKQRLIVRCHNKKDFFQSLYFTDRQKKKYISFLQHVQYLPTEINGFGTSDNSVENFSKQSLLDYSSDIRKFNGERGCICYEKDCFEGL